MSSLRQIETIRRNVLRSTGPTTGAGKHRSRRNALRRGLTAEAVIEVLEDPKDSEAFEKSVIVDFDAQPAVERELVLHWLRRATETGLLQIQATSYVRPDPVCAVERRSCRNAAATRMFGSLFTLKFVRTQNRSETWHSPPFRLEQSKSKAMLPARTMRLRLLGLDRRRARSALMRSRYRSSNRQGAADGGRVIENIR
jgi:hypothetical protein